jgi:hypothetical protein
MITALITAGARLAAIVTTSVPVDVLVTDVVPIARAAALVPIVIVPVARPVVTAEWWARKEVITTSRECRSTTSQLYEHLKCSSFTFSSICAPFSLCNTIRELPLAFSHVRQIPLEVRDG